MGEAKISKGVKQRRCLLPTRFNLFIEEVFEERNEKKSGVNVQEHKIRTVRLHEL